ncbi:MAG: ComEC/Rec2 family competence protein [Mangrovibacterium sp.]
MRVGLACSLICCLTLTTLSGRSQPKVGEEFPLWTEGYLDIHHINTGKGESVFFLLPDGTTMLVDAGATARPKPRVTDPRPDGSRTPGEWISRYILHFLGNQPEKKLDYVLLTHFHDDHMGELYPGLKTSSNGDYVLTGITEVGENIPFVRIVDRNWPDYNWPEPLKSGYIQNYIRFVRWQAENRGLKAEQFQVGENDQFTLLRNRAKYPGFEIRNLAANGHVWTGYGKNERNHFPAMEDLSPAEYPGENQLSIAFRLSYGKFDYFNGGDLTTGAPGTWQDIETPVGLAAGPVDVCEVNHHAYYDAMGVSFIQAVRPRVFIIQSWAPSHPSPSVISRMMSSWTYPGPRDIFSTNMMEETWTVIGSRIDDMKSRQGHIVIRVNPGGDNYMIYILDDAHENFKVKAIHGPYSSN